MKVIDMHVVLLQNGNLHLSLVADMYKNIFSFTIFHSLLDHLLYIFTIIGTQ